MSLIERMLLGLPAIKSLMETNERLRDELKVLNEKLEQQASNIHSTNEAISHWSTLSADAAREADRRLAQVERIADAANELPRLYESLAYRTALIEGRTGMPDQVTDQDWNVPVRHLDWDRS